MRYNPSSLPKSVDMQFHISVPSNWYSFFQIQRGHADLKLFYVTTSLVFAIFQTSANLYIMANMSLLFPSDVLTNVKKHISRSVDMTIHATAGSVSLKIRFRCSLESIRGEELFGTVRIVYNSMVWVFGGKTARSETD